MRLQNIEEFRANILCIQLSCRTLKKLVLHHEISRIEFSRRWRGSFALITLGKDIC